MGIPDSRSERNVEQTVFLEYPIVAVSGRNTQIPVFVLFEFQVIAQWQIFRQFPIVKIQFMQIKGESGFPGSAALFLYRALGIGCRIGKAFVVEDIIGIDTDSIAPYSIEILSFQLFYILIKSAQTA